jgi:ubiquinone/menaquinone biosynthesis C-methylase UbiE
MGFYSNVIIPFFYDYSMDSPKINENRKNILDKISEEELVEIGIGTGINLKFYPQNVKKIIGLDSNRGMLNQLLKKLVNGGTEAELIHQRGESLPFSDNSIGAIVSTYTLCSIKDINSALKEIYRVLKPGGKYYFLEHGLADNPKTQKWQHRLNMIQNIWADGCNLNRNMEFLITNAELKIIELKNYYMKRDPKIVGYMYEGIAVK